MIRELNLIRIVLECDKCKRLYRSHNTIECTKTYLEQDTNLNDYVFTNREYYYCLTITDAKMCGWIISGYDKDNILNKRIKAYCPECKEDNS